MNTAHLTSVERIGGGWRATCLCGWSKDVTKSKDDAPGTRIKVRAKQVAWQHWASSPVGVEGSA